MHSTRPSAFGQLAAALHITPQMLASGLDQAATAFAHTYWVAWALVALTLVPALMLPKRKATEPEGEAPAEVPVPMH
jgi:hypothetical protein